VANAPFTQRHDHHAMTRPLTSRILLLEERRGGSPASGKAPVRRYRLARVALAGGDPAAAERFAYLKRGHD
jgi:hypothetical protein